MPRELSPDIVEERYGLTIGFWRTLTETQRSGYRSQHHKSKKALCDCGNVATTIFCGDKVCERCANIPPPGDF